MKAVTESRVSWKCSVGSVALITSQVMVDRLERSIRMIQSLGRIPKTLSQKVTVAETTLLQGRKTMILIQNDEDVSNGRDSRYPQWYQSQIDKLQINISSNILGPESGVEMEIFVCELMRKKLCSALTEIFYAKCVYGTVGSITVDREEIISLRKSYNSLIEEINNFLTKVVNLDIEGMDNSDCSQQYLKNIVHINQLCKFILQLRAYVMKSEWEQINTCFQENLELEPHFNDEISLIRHEMEHLLLIKEFKSVVVQLEVTMFPNTFEINSSPDAIFTYKLNNAITRAKVVGCHNDLSTKLLKIAVGVYDMMELIKSSKAHDVNLQKMVAISKEYDELQLDNSSLLSVTRFVRKHQIVHKLYIAVTETTETRNLYIVILKVKAACSDGKSDSIGQEVVAWIQIAEDLRQLRVLKKDQDWPAIKDHISKFKNNLNLVEANNDEEKAFKLFVSNEMNVCAIAATSAFVDAQLSIATDSGRIGSKGNTTYCVPDKSVEILKHMLNDMERDKEFVDVEKKNKLQHLLNLRESVRDELNVRQTISMENVGDSPSKFYSSNASARITAARHHTQEYLNGSKLHMNFAQSECNLVSRMSELTILIENLEKIALLPVITWTDQNQVEFHNQTSKLQLEIIQKITSSFSDSLDDIPLIKVNR